LNGFAAPPREDLEPEAPRQGSGDPHRQATFWLQRHRGLPTVDWGAHASGSSNPMDSLRSPPSRPCPAWPGPWSPTSVWR